MSVALRTACRGVVGQKIGYAECARETAVVDQSGWYAVGAMPRCELRVSEELKRRGFSPYIPMEARLVRVRGHKKTAMVKSSRPIFPGYVFIDIAGAANWWLIDNMPGVLGVICVGNSPIRIRRAEVERIRERECEGEFDYTTPAKIAEEAFLRLGSDYNFKVGDVVTLKEGPFSGFPATVAKMPTTIDEPVELSIAIFGRTTPWRLPLDKIRDVA